MDYKIGYTKNAQRDLDRLDKTNLKIITDKLSENSKLENPLDRAKKWIFKVQSKRPS